MGEKVRPPHVDDELERRFDDAMMEIYQRAGAEVWE
jgi:hypothetical protein